jgi:hypothetical protein
VRPYFNQGASVPSHALDPVDLCEAALRHDIQQNKELKIWPAHTRIAQRFLARRLELTELYTELVEALGPDPQRLRAFFDCVFDATHLWSPEKLIEAREHRAELTAVNVRVAQLAQELAGQLERRSELNNAGRFRSETMYHVCDLIAEASRSNPSFEWYLKPGLEALRGQFDLKYWPELSDLLHALARDAAAAEIKAGDSLTAAGTESLRPSRTDFFRVLFEAFHEYTRRGAPFLEAFRSLTGLSLRR